VGLEILTEWFDSTLRTRLNERKCKWNETRIFDWEVHLTHPPKPDQEKCLVRANRKRPVLSSSMHSRGKFVLSRWLGRRPIVRGVAMNPVDHPHGSVRGFMLINRILGINFFSGKQSSWTRWENLVTKKLTTIELLVRPPLHTGRTIHLMSDYLRNKTRYLPTSRVERLY
jgi:hypothetical protein